MNSISLQIAQQIRDIHPLLVQCCCYTVYDAGPTLNQHVFMYILFAERPSRDITLSSPGGALVPNDRKTGTLQTRLL